MERIGIIGAMEEEVIAIRRKMQVEEMRIIAGMEFYAGILEEQRIVLVRCGIGKVNAAVCTQAMIDHFEVDCVINTGVAGGLYPELEIGDIIISSDTVQHDVDACAFGYKPGVIPRMDESFFGAEESLVKIAKQAAENLKSKPTVYVARVASGDQFVSSMQVKENIWNTFTAYCAEMEGAAIAHTAYLNKIPFVIIRSISDKADQSADISFDEFVHVAARNSSGMIYEMVKELTK